MMSFGWQSKGLTGVRPFEDVRRSMINKEHGGME